MKRYILKITIICFIACLFFKSNLSIGFCDDDDYKIPCVKSHIGFNYYFEIVE